MYYPIRFFVAAIMTSAASVASASDGNDAPRAKALDQLVACKMIADGPARLACYDREVQELDVAERDHQVMIVDREQLRDVKRSLFGLRLPVIRLFSDDNKSDDSVTTITSKIQTLRTLPDGRVGFTLPDGASWLQEDDRILAGRVDPGATVVIRRGALGSYIATIGHRPGFKVHRSN